MGRRWVVLTEVPRGRLKVAEDELDSASDDLHQDNGLRPSAPAGFADRPSGRRRRQTGATGNLRRIRQCYDNPTRFGLPVLAVLAGSAAPS